MVGCVGISLAKIKEEREQREERGTEKGKRSMKDKTESRNRSQEK